jgi:hypothetical protein
MEKRISKKAIKISQWKKVYGLAAGMVYQFPKGHWGYCSANSPIGLRLVACGYIYPGVPALDWELI